MGDLMRRAELSSRRFLNYRMMLAATMVLCGIIAAYAFTAIAQKESADLLKSLTLVARERDARRVAADIDGLFREENDRIAALASYFEHTGLGTETRDKLEFAQLVTGHFDLLEIVDLSGKTLYSSAPESATEHSLDPAAKDWFNAAIDKPMISPLYEDSGKLFWAFIYPLQGANGGTGAVLLGRSPAAVVGEMLSDGVELGETEHIHVLDKSGLTVVTTGGLGGSVVADSTKSLGAKISANSRGVGFALSGKSGTASYVEERNKETLAGFAPLKTIGGGSAR